MNSRRDFFRQFAGHAAKINDEIKGSENTHVKRFPEITDETAGKIIPVFREGAKWEIKDGAICIFNEKTGKNESYDLNQTELKAMEFFGKNMNLAYIAEEIKSGSALHISEIFQSVKSLFIRLTELKICEYVNN